MARRPDEAVPPDAPPHAALSREVVHRVAVDVSRDAEGFDDALESHLARRPSGFCARLSPYGFSFRREPAVFHFVATGTSLGSAILLAEFSTRIPRAVTTLAMVLSAAFFVLALACLWYFLHNAAARLEIVADSDVVKIRRRGLFGVDEQALDGGKIVAVLVVKDPDDRGSIVIAGPRHEALLELHRPRFLDPDSLPAWIADGIALVARRSTVRARLVFAADALADAPRPGAARGPRPLTVR